MIIFGRNVISCSEEIKNKCEFEFYPRLVSLSCFMVSFVSIFHAKMKKNIVIEKNENHLENRLIHSQIMCKAFH